MYFEEDKHRKTYRLMGYYKMHVDANIAQNYLSATDGGFSFPLSNKRLVEDGTNIWSSPYQTFVLPVVVKLNYSITYLFSSLLVVG